VAGVDLASPELLRTRDRLRTRFGAVVEPWWGRLPAALAELGDRWDLDLEDPVGRGNTSLVVRCRRNDGRRAILKLTPETVLAREEAFALRRFESSSRTPLVWADDPAIGALLLEEIPGAVPLAETPREIHTSEISALIAALHGVGADGAGGQVTTLASRVEFLFELWIRRRAANDDASRLVSVARLERGRERASALAGDGGTQVLLHGDLHPANVLDGGSTRGLVAIDPRPCVGDAPFDVIDWVFWGTHERRAWEARAQAIASTLDLHAERCWEWCRAIAPILATSAASRSEPAAAVEALLDLAR
jgi:streptomycin 6-kinase